MARKRVPHPRFNGYVCIVKGCTRVDHKHGLCRHHWNLVPMEDRMRAMVNSIHAASRAAKREDAGFEQWARAYEAGTANVYSRPTVGPVLAAQLAAAEARLDS